MSDRDRPSRLGRGLASLLGQSDHSPGDQPGTLPVTSLRPGPFQPRRDMTANALDELAASIKVHGVLQPLLVRSDPLDETSFQIIAGERRWRAAQKVGLHDVPVLIRDLDDVASLAAALIENLQREDLNAMEEAEGLRRLADEFGLTQEMVATSVGRSRSHVANTIRLLSLPASIQDRVRQGVLSAGHARALLAHPHPETAAHIVQSKGLNVRQTEALARPPDKHAARFTRQQTSIDITALETDLTATLGLRVSLSFDGTGGRLNLRYTSLDQLEGLVRRLKAT